MGKTTQAAKAKATDQSTQPVLLLMTAHDMLRVVLAGAVVGLVTIALYYMLDRYVFTPVLCGESASGIGSCESKAYFSSGLAMALGALAGLFAMVNQRVFRPLLIVLLVTIGLWNIPPVLAMPKSRIFG